MYYLLILFITYILIDYMSCGLLLDPSLRNTRECLELPQNVPELPNLSSQSIGGRLLSRLLGRSTFPFYCYHTQLMQAILFNNLVVKLPKEPATPGITKKIMLITLGKLVTLLIDSHERPTFVEIHNELIIIKKKI